MNGIKILEKEIEQDTPDKVKRLTNIKGISTITACTIYTETKGRLLSKAQFASYCGVAPIDCSSGKTNRKKKKNNKGKIGY